MMFKRWLLLGCFSLCFTGVFSQMVSPEGWTGYESVLGVVNGLRHYDYDVTVTGSTTATNVLWPGEQAGYSIQIVNNTGETITGEAKVHVIRYGTMGKEGNIWLPEMYLIGETKPETVAVSVNAMGYANIFFRPVIPDAFGGYALVLEIPGHGRRLITSLIRTFRTKPARVQYPHQSLDDLGPEFLQRIGIQAIRMGIEYTPTDASDYRSKMEALDRRLQEYRSHNITVLLMIGAGTASMPLGGPRGFLDSAGVMLNTKQDYAWLPSRDKDFKEFVYRLCRNYGWPGGPVTAVSLWNEPWEGISISGWQADMLRYREIYREMAAGVLDARKEGVSVLVGGADSHSNAWDKLFADGSMEFLPIFDFCSIHYEGMESPALYPAWIHRQSPMGRVKIWDTESWVGNTDDRIALVVAVNRSAGYDRSMGIYGGYLHTGGAEDGNHPMVRIRTEDGAREVDRTPETWSQAAAMAAVQHLVGERDFSRLLFTNGLPWIMVFDGQVPDDGTVVIGGDIGDAFGHENVLFRGVKLQSGARLTIPADPAFRLFDFYGNIVPDTGGRIVVPLTYRGYFLRTDGSKGSFQRLVAALQHSDIRGYDPVEIIAKDPTVNIGQTAALTLHITNILNRTVNGDLRLSMAKLRLKAPGRITLRPHESRDVLIPVIGGETSVDNTYALSVVFDGGADGETKLNESMHVNVISHLHIQVDGKLDDWKGALPQPVQEGEKTSLSVTEAAWYPFKNFTKHSEGLANGYLGYDDQYFYFAAKVADHTPHPGTYRFADRPDDEFFYPDTAWAMNPDNSFQYREVQAPADANDSSALQLPDGRGRNFRYMENAPVTRSFALDLSLGDSGSSRVSFYLPNLDVFKAQIDIYDVSTGARICSRTVDQLWKGAWEQFRLSGRVRVVFRSLDWWYTVKLAGVFFDKDDSAGSMAGKGEGAARAFYLGEDLDTRGEWRQKYGSAGWFIPGGVSYLPARYLLAPVTAKDMEPLVWPKGARRYTYRKDPVLPDNSGLGYAYDNVLIAFNVIPIGEDGLLANPPGTMPRYTGYKCTDYEFALNQVAPAYGGGTEIWRLLVPGMNRKHFFPRQPKSPGEGPMVDGRLAVVHDGDTRITECAIPWSEIPEVKAALDKGVTIKFSFRINDNGSPDACLELARGRSVSKKNSRAFHPDWKTHWANEVEFGFEK
jgi:hypothetical protein